MSDIALIPTGTANVASIVAAFRRLGLGTRETASPDDVGRAAGVVVPGVGSFGAAMARIDAAGMGAALRDRVDADLPTLFVCVGMQLLCASSEESPGAVGLGLFEQRVERFTGDHPVPQMGWNRIVPAGESVFVEPGWAYFANSYRMRRIPPGWTASTTGYGGDFVSTIERGSVLACQFHPELSGEWGAGLLRRWVATTGEAA